MIPGINIHNEHENGIIQLAFSLRHLKQIHLEPYHRIGESKRERLGMVCMDATEIPDRSQLEAMAKRIATATGIETLVM